MNLVGDSDYLEKLSLKGDPLERLEKVVDSECFRPTLNRIFKYDLKNKSHGGRPPYDLVLMLKILILQRLYNLSDDAMEYQMIDRISFRRFLKIDDKVPDAKTIWDFRNQLSKSNRGNWLFSAFQEKLGSQGNSPDQKCILAPNLKNGYALYPIDGGEIKDVLGLKTADTTLRYASDGQVYVSSGQKLPIHVEKVDLTNGQRTLWKLINPSDPAGMLDIS